MDDLRAKRVLVTGAAGFVGANLTRELVGRGAQVHALVKPSTDLWRIAEVIPRLTLHRGDLTDREELSRIIHRIRPEIIFHLAATGGHPCGQQDRERALWTNVLGTANLLAATAPVDYQCFVHFGSSLEYGAKQEPLKESDRLEPFTFRGVAKAAATLLCQQFARANHRPVAVLRPFSVYGYWETPTRFIPTAIKAALSNQEIALTASGYRHDFIFVADVVEACLLALKAEKIAGEIINVGSGQQWSNEEVIDVIQALCGQRIQVRVGEYLGSPSDTTHWVADIQKAKQLLGWEPRHTLQSGLEKTISWFRLHGNAYLEMTYSPSLSLSAGRREEKAGVKVAPALAGQGPEISVIIPVYRNKETLHELYRRLHHVLVTRALSYEMLFVDDACPENSVAVLEELAQGDPRVAVVALEQNVGQHRAVLAGLSHARGKWAVIMDADLQDPPEAIPDLLDKLQEGRAAVFAGRRGQYESRFRLITSRLFKGLLHLLVGVPTDAGLFVAMNRQMVERLLQFGKLSPSVTAMMGCTGLALASIPVVRAQRPVGGSAYSFGGRVKAGLAAIAWVLSWKWRPPRPVSGGSAGEVPVRAYIGARFAPARERGTEKESIREAVASTRAGRA